MANPWITHVQNFAKKNKISYKEAISKARASYKKGGAKTQAPNSKKPKLITK